MALVISHHASVLAAVMCEFAFLESLSLWNFISLN